MPFLRQVVHAEKSQVQVRSLMEVRNTGVQGLARSFEGHKMGKASLGIPEKVGEQTRPPAPSMALRGSRQSQRCDARVANPKDRRLGFHGEIATVLARVRHSCGRGTPAEPQRPRLSSVAFPYSPRDGAPRGAPDL